MIKPMTDKPDMPDEAWLQKTHTGSQGLYLVEEDEDEPTFFHRYVRGDLYDAVVKERDILKIEMEKIRNETKKKVPGMMEQQINIVNMFANDALAAYKGEKE